VASYKHDHYIARSDSDEFDKDHQPGEIATILAFYLCMGCARETAINHGEPLPSRNHHEHVPSQGVIRWRLIVYPTPISRPPPHTEGDRGER
jgi:hypothetical protein